MKRVAYSSGNHLLDALPKNERAKNKVDLEVIALAAHQVTHAIDTTVDFVDFPIDAVLSVVASFKNGTSVEVGTIGSESFVESDVALDSPSSQRTSFCQIRGTVGRMSLQRFEYRMATSGSFARLMRRNVRAALFSSQQFAACNAKHTIPQRCARWLLMCEDRVGSAQFKLTHDFLSIMLGVRRPGVSEAADALQKMVP